MGLEDSPLGPFFKIGGDLYLKGWGAKIGPPFKTRKPIHFGLLCFF